MKRFLHWLETRVGGFPGLKAAFLGPLPGGPRWQYCWLSLILFVFGMQVVTGFFLWANYSPSTQTAWESVYHLQRQTQAGWFLRGLHHYTSQAFVVLLALHIAQLILTRACRAPREVAYWLALLLLPLALAMCVTGWLLPFDQKGYWAARVPLNLIALVPVLGPALQTLALGGTDVGHHTLTRFLALHAGLFPLLLGTGLLLHWRLSWSQIRSDAAAGPVVGRYWPDQAWRDAAACCLVGIGLAGLVTWLGGAPLGAPADPSEASTAARPEWFMLFLFQFLKLFHGPSSEIIGAILIPTLLFVVFLLMPFLARWRTGHWINCGIVVVVGLAIAGFTAAAWRQDRNDPLFLAALEQAARESKRAQALASSPSGIPPEGGLRMMRADPLHAGPRLFARHCASCHRYDGHDGLGQVPSEPATAGDLKDFASRTWLTGLLDHRRVDTTDYFGGTAFKQGRMVRFVKRDVADFDDLEREQLRKVIVALSAEAGLRYQKEMDHRDQALIGEGRGLMADPTLRCLECHKFYEHEEDPSGPDLTGYGSRTWLLDFVRDPAHDRFYGRRNDRMPRFGEEPLVTAEELERLVDWLRGEWWEPDAQTSP